MATIEQPLPVAAEADTSTFSFREAREIVKDLMAPRQWIFWTDMILSAVIGYTFASLYLELPGISIARVACYFIAGFALFRAGTFIHEIVHLRRNSMLGFQVAWNLLCGIPMLMPSFFYENHADHHRKDHYGTHHDGEYLPLGAGPVRHFLFYFMQALALPILVVIRFLIITPLSFFHSGLRQWALERASSYGINPGYRREIPASAPRKIWGWLEVGCFIRTAAMIAVVLFGVYHWTRLFELYTLAVMVIGLNYVRNLTAHRYRNKGEEMTYLGQLEDSVNITGSPILTELFFPLGLRYHALHHLFPSIPYHSLGTAHRRLMEKLPADSPYRKTVCPGYWSVVRQIYSDARASGAARPAAQG